MKEAANFLSHFMTEDIYVVKNEIPETSVVELEAFSEAPQITTDVRNVIEGVPEAIDIEIESKDAIEEKIGEVEKIEIKLIVLRLQSNKSQESQETDLLNNILKAIKIPSDDVVIINVDKEKDINSTLGHYNFKSAISFGVPFLKELFSDSLKYYEPQQMNGYSFLLSHSLEELAQDAARQDITRKKLLWKGLQGIFNL